MIKVRYSLVNLTAGDLQYIAGREMNKTSVASDNVGCKSKQSSVAFSERTRESEFGRHAIARLIDVIQTCIRLDINRWDLARKYDAIGSENNASLMLRPVSYTHIPLSRSRQVLFSINIIFPITGLCYIFIKKKRSIPMGCSLPNTDFKPSKKSLDFSDFFRIFAEKNLRIFFSDFYRFKSSKKSFFGDFLLIF